MMQQVKKYPRLIRFLMIGVMGLVLSSNVSNAQAAANNAAAINDAAVISTINANRTAMTAKFTEMVKDFNDTLMESSGKMKAVAIEILKQNRLRAMDDMPNYDEITGISLERARSGILSDGWRIRLNETNYQMTSSYKVVPSAGTFGKDGTYANGNLVADAFMFNLHVRLFCNKEGMKNPPVGCGADRERAGITENQNFIDFFLSDRTWPKAYVLDVVQLARAYFFKVPDKLSIAGLKNGGAGFVRYIENLAKTNLRMSILNDLAARRAPTSTATDDVLKMLLTNFAERLNVSSVDYTQVCSQDKPSSDFDAYVCKFTNIPDPNLKENMSEEDKKRRIIGQAAIDRIMQNDYYLSSHFYDSINASGVSAKGSLDKMEVYMLTQQLAQDYRLYRLLQMKTMAQAIQPRKRP